jgi:hypothetical protein
MPETPDALGFYTIPEINLFSLAISNTDISEIQYRY